MVLGISEFIYFGATESSSGRKGQDVEKVCIVLCALFSDLDLGLTGVHARISSYREHGIHVPPVFKVVLHHKQ